jgi:hypothetical protein
MYLARTQIFGCKFDGLEDGFSKDIWTVVEVVRKASEAETESGAVIKSG